MRLIIMLTLPKKQKKQKNEFICDIELSPNRDFNLNNQKDAEKWFSYISKHTNMTYEPETAHNWNRCRYCVLINQVEYRIVLWFSKSSGLHFSIESQLASFEQDFAPYCANSSLLNVKDFFSNSTVGEFVAELNKVIKSLKQYQIQKKKQDIEKDFRNDI